MNANKPETVTAIRAAGIAQRIADSRDGANLVTSKGGLDLVTATDVACEDSIRAELVHDFPDYPVIGEERGGAAVDGRPYWLVDPICGTRHFASDIPLYCTNITLVENGRITAAVMAMGRTGEILYAESGSGAWMITGAGEHRVVVGDRSDTIWIDGETDHAAAVVRAALLRRRWYVAMFSSSVAYAHLAAGRIGGIIHFESTPVDEYGSVHTSAGWFIAREAGAVATDFKSNAVNFQTRSFLLAATPQLHHELLGLVRETS